MNSATHADGEVMGMAMPKRFVLLVAVAMCMCSLGANADPVFSKARKYLRVVGENEEDVGSYCILHLYFRRSGVKWMLDHRENRPLDPQLYLRWPGTVDKGSDYEFGYWPYSEFVGPFVTESYGHFKRIIAKNGYQLLMYDKYSDPLNPRTVVLQRGDSEDFMKRLLDGKVSQEELRTLYRITDAQQEIVVTLDAEDKERLKKCYYAP